MKKCPYCSEDIQDDANKCKHYGKNLLSPQESQSRFAGFWRRFLAMLIDIVFLIIYIDYIIGYIIGFWIGFLIGVIEPEEATIQTIVQITNYALWIVLSWFYFTSLESSRKQATLGKMALGIIVTDLNGKRVSFGRANGRHWGKIVSSIILGIGFIMAGFTEKKQALHDIMAGTLVVKK